MDGPERSQPDGPHDPVVVATSGSRLEAMLTVTALEDAGHTAALLSDDAGGLHPEMSYLYRGAYRILVPSPEAEAARAYLAELDAGEHAFAPEPAPPGDASPDGPERGLGLDGHRSAWIAVTVVVVAIFVVFRIVDSAQSFGWF